MLKFSTYMGFIH